MAEVPDHLIPSEGLTNSFIRFDALQINHGSGSVDVAFGIYDEDQRLVANFDVEVAIQGGGTNRTIAEAHRVMTDILRQWLYMTDMMRQAYEKNDAPLAEDQT